MVIMMTEIYIDWYEAGKTCVPELDYPDHVCVQFCEDGEVVYQFYIDDMSYDDAEKLYENMSVDESKYDVFFDTL